jgi:hypothetical protein
VRALQRGTDDGSSAEARWYELSVQWVLPLNIRFCIRRLELLCLVKGDPNDVRMDLEAGAYLSIWRLGVVASSAQATTVRTGSVQWYGPLNISMQSIGRNIEFVGPVNRTVLEWNLK